MICKEKWKRSRAISGITVAASLVILVCSAHASAAPKYPDLRSLPPSDFHLGTALVDGENHYVVRFTNLIANAGTGPFELHGAPHFPVDGQFDASQWIYDDTVGLTIEPVGVFAFHPSHQHFHFDGFARYELWRKRDYDRAAAVGFSAGAPLFTSPKVSFCILDLSRYDNASGPPTAVYRTCSPAMEGLSAGWADVYDWTLPDQWVDVGQTPLPDGEYVMRTIADPGNIVHESPGKADPNRESQIANSASSPITILNGRLSAGA